MKNEVMVSIIIPVYNVEKYLQECLESAINQTYKNIEIIAINDGSTDSSLAILEEYASKYGNLKIVNQENKGMSGARNAGLKVANGEYIYFLDSDDFIDLNMIEECVVLAEKNNLDIINFDAHVFYDGDFKSDFNPKYNRSKFLNQGIYLGQDFYRYSRNNNAYRAAVWLSFYRTDFLRNFNLNFYEGITHEDELFSTQAFILASKVMYESKAYFHRRIREGSIMTQAKSLKNIEGYMTVSVELHKLLNVIDNNDTKKILKKQILGYYNNCIYLSVLVFENQEELNTQIQQIRNIVFSNYTLKDIDKKLLIKLIFPHYYIKRTKNKLTACC
ncbi:glycosyltransferase [Turicibacter sanguinis]|uniref:glycosyltransferase n=1 Tax=Turicibacter sanguinis TaxID=154288 RepID=UPI0018AB3012|nr:glycosyltransferase [Turicibacter sanguinis]